MTKSLFIDPEVKRKPGKITFEEIPIFAYDKTLSEERENYSKDDLLGIYHDMVLIREFEMMLIDIKTKGEYKGISYSYFAPIHPSLGQEAASVGMAYELGIEDIIFGTHRSHADVLAKGMSAIKKLTDDELLKIMEEFRGGITLETVKKQTKTTDVKELAKHFLIFGMVSEIFAKEAGFNSGMGGSMHAFFTPFGIYPNNAIVGGSAPIATGAALYKKVNKKPGIAVCNIGDGAIGCGPVYESMNFAAMDQYNTMWEEGYKGGLPIVFNIFNNQYGMGGQTCGVTMAYEHVARLAAGITPSQMYTERIDGINPLAVIDAYKRKLPILKEQKKGPVLLDVLFYRLSGHSTADANSYREEAEIEAWRKYDPVPMFRQQLLDEKIAEEIDLETIENWIAEDIYANTKLATDDEKAPFIDMVKKPYAIADIMFSNGSIEKMEDRAPDVLGPLEENPRIKAIAKKERFYMKDEKPVSQNKVFQFRDAIFEAMMHRFYEDPTLIGYGEDVRDWGGAYAVTRDMLESLPVHRFFNSPISEAAIAGTAVGYALSGGRVIVELMYIDFMGRAGDEIINQMAKWQAMSDGLLKMPMVLRMMIGGQYGAQHSQDFSAICAHVPGLKVVCPATPYDAKGLMNSALKGTDPVIFIEPQELYPKGEQFHEGGVPEGYYEIPLGEPDIKKKGSDITILAVGLSVYTAVEAAQQLEEKYGLSAEIIDARTLVPFNYEPVLESVKKTGRLVVCGHAVERSSFMANLAHNVQEMAFDYLDAPVCVVGSKNWIAPAHAYEKAYYTQASWILDTINEKILPLNGYTPTQDMSLETKIAMEKRGV